MSNKNIIRRALVYARFSTMRQNMSSADDQIREGERYAVREGMTVVACPRDEAMSGEYGHGRSGLAELKRLADLRGFDVLIIESIDRLGRNNAEVATLCRWLKYRNIEIHTYTSGKQSDIVIGLMSVVSEAMLEEVRIKTRRGGRSNVERQLSAGGRSYGYRPKLISNGRGQYEPGHLEIHEEEAKTVRRIYDEYAAGKSPVEIARSLNIDGIPGPRRRRKRHKGELCEVETEFTQWQVSTISGHASRGTGILRNTLYCGRRIYNKLTYVKDPDTGLRVSRRNPKEDILEVEVSHLRIVSDKQWQAVRARESLVSAQMKESAAPDAAKFRAARRTTSFLSGRIVCASCGGQVGLVLRDRWGCLGRHRGSTCTNNRTKARSIVEQRVLSGLISRLVIPEAIQVAFEAYQTEQRDLYERWMRQADTNREKIRSLDSQIKNLLRAIKFTPDIDELSTELAQVSAERKILAQNVRPLPAPPSELPLNFPELFRTRVSSLTEVLNDPDVGYQASDALRRLIQVVEFRRGEGRGKVELTLKGDLVAVLELGAGNDNLALMTEAVACPRNQ